MQATFALFSKLNESITYRTELRVSYAEASTTSLYTLNVEDGLGKIKIQKISGLPERIPCLFGAAIGSLHQGGFVAGNGMSGGIYMESSGGYSRGLLMLSVFFALSLGAAVAANAPVSVGADITNIISVNYMGVNQWVEIANEGTGSMNLTGWTLMNIENQTYSFPANFTLKAGSLVKVHAEKGNNSAADLFNSTLLWNKEGDTATLKDATGKIVSEYKYPIKVSAPGSVTKIEPLLLQNMSSIGGTSQPFLPDYKSDYGADRGSLKSSSPVNLTGHSFICHGGPLNWAWTTGLG